MKFFLITCIIFSSLFLLFMALAVIESIKNPLGYRCFYLWLIGYIIGMIGVVITAIMKYNLEMIY